MTTAGFVLAPASATTDPEVLRRLEEMRTVLGRLELEVGRLASKIDCLSGGDDR